MVAISAAAPRLGTGRPPLVARRVRRLRVLGTGFRAGITLVAVGVLLVIALLVLVLTEGAWLSLDRFGPAFLLSTPWDAVHSAYGAAPAIAGTLLTSALALLIAVPISLGVAIFLTDVAPRWVRRPLTYLVDLGAAIPSVVYGFWAFLVLVPRMQSTIEPGLRSLSGGAFPFESAARGQDVLTATIVLAVMIIPTIAAVARESLRAIPRIHRESALSLGATRWEATRLGVLAPARAGIFAGVILGLGRALGETIAVAMVIGNRYIVPDSLFSPGATLASAIVNFFPDSQPGINRSAVVELALILLAITVVVNVAARLLLRRLGKEDPEDRAPARRGLRSRGPRPLRPGTMPSTGIGRRPPARAAAPPRIARRRGVQGAVVALTGACVVLILIPFGSVIVTAVQYGGAAVVQPSFYSSVPPLGCNPTPSTSCSLGGIGPEIQGTLIVLGIAALIAIPVGILAGIYLAEYGRNPFARTLSFLADVMTGVPTIILGVFVFSLFLVMDHDAALSVLSGGVALGVLMIPIAVRGTEEALRAVPRGLRESALALGFPRHRVTLRVVLGCARGGIVTGMLLAVSRAAGDTATLLLTMGGSSFWFQNFHTPTAAMTPFIFTNFGSQYGNLQTDAWGAALVLMGVMLAISLGTRWAVPESAGAGEAE